MEIGAYALSIVCVLFGIAVLIWNRRFTELSLAWERQLVRLLHWRSMEWFVDLREELLGPKAARAFVIVWALLWTSVWAAGILFR